MVSPFDLQYVVCCNHHLCSSLIVSPAQFTPHVDSGRGMGQTVSMIVGLGNYTGGETIVEGISYDIRYNALEFDGWNQLHWTSQFQGER